MKLYLLLEPNKVSYQNKRTHYNPRRKLNHVHDLRAFAPWSHKSPAITSIFWCKLLCIKIICWGGGIHSSIPLALWWGHLAQPLTLGSSHRFSATFLFTLHSCFTWIYSTHSITITSKVLCVLASKYWATELIFTEADTNMLPSQALISYHANTNTAVTS